MNIQQRYEPTADVRAAIEVVNGLITESAGKWVLLNWHDCDEAKGTNFGIFDNPKREFEGQHIAVGVLTGEPVLERYEGPHWICDVPTIQKKQQRVVWPRLWRWGETHIVPTNLGGGYPSLEAAEDTGHSWLGESTVQKRFRRMQIVVDEAEVADWLRSHRHTAADAEKILSEIRGFLA